MTTARQTLAVLAEMAAFEMEPRPPTLAEMADILLLLLQKKLIYGKTAKTAKTAKPRMAVFT